MADYYVPGYMITGYYRVPEDTQGNFTFDGHSKLIILGSGVVSIDVDDMYSRWVDWMKIGDNSKYPLAFRFVGGDAISNTKDLGLTFFIINGWRIRPQEADHRLEINGNLYTDPSGFSPLTSTVGSYNVMVEMAVSSLVDSSLAQLPEIEQASFNGQIALDPENRTGRALSGTAYPAGTRVQPCLTLADAKTIGVSRGITEIYLMSNITIGATDNVAGYVLEGVGATLNVSSTSHTTVTLTQGCVTTNSHWKHCRITGYQGGESYYEDCIIDGLENAHCFYERCGMLDGTSRGWTIKQAVSSIGHASYYKECFSDEGTFILDRNGAAMNVTMDGFHGRCTIKNQNKSTGSGQVWMHLNGGTLTVDSTCTKGKITITGFGTLSNSSQGTEVDASGFAAEVAVQARLDVESMRGSHQGFGTRWYVDPVNGNDASPGTSASSPLKTVTAAISNSTSGRGDVIYLISPGSGTSTLDERILLNKEDVHIRAPGRGLQIQPSTVTSDPVINITANNCSINGVLIRTSVGGSEDGIVVNAKFCRLENLYIVGPDTGGVSPIGAGVGIHFKGGDYHKIFGCEIEKFGSDGVKFTDAPISSEGSPREARFDNCTIYYNRGAGVNFTGASSNSTRLNVITGCRIHHNSSYGVIFGANTQRNMIMSDNYIKDNQTYPSGTGGQDSEIYIDPSASDAMVDTLMNTLVPKIWAEDLSTYTTGTAGHYIYNKILTVAKFLGLK